MREKEVEWERRRDACKVEIEDAMSSFYFFILHPLPPLPPTAPPFWLSILINFDYLRFAKNGLVRRRI